MLRLDHHHRRTCAGQYVVSSSGREKDIETHRHEFFQNGQVVPTANQREGLLLI